jgi:TPR repeat protein
MYRDGLGVPKDAGSALKWLKKGADAGDSNSAMDIGEVYRQGQGVPVDYAGAMKWYRQAADEGNDMAMYHIGQMYDAGNGVKADRQAALEWYRKGADLGNDDCRAKLKVLTPVTQPTATQPLLRVPATTQSVRGS